MWVLRDTDEGELGSLVYTLKKVSYPNALWALFLSDQTRFVLNGSRQANAHWVPNFHALLQ